MERRIWMMGVVMVMEKGKGREGELMTRKKRAC